MAIRSGAKIAFMGAGATGKSTDAEVLAEKLGIPLMKSASRQVYEQLKISEDDCLKMSNEERWEIQEKIFTIKELNDDQSFEFVADRTLLDHWAYCLMYCGAFMLNNEFLKFETNVRKHMRGTYTHLFYFPWGYWTPEKEDGIRQAAHGWQSAIDAIIAGYCMRWNLPVIQVPQIQGPEARQEFIVQSVLGEKK